MKKVNPATAAKKHETEAGSESAEELAPPHQRSPGAKETSGVQISQDRDDDVEMVDESELLDEMGFAAEQAIAHGVDVGAEVDPPLAKPAIRPRAPQLPPKGERGSSPGLDALAKIEARKPSVPPRPTPGEKRSGSKPDLVSEAVAKVDADVDDQKVTPKLESSAAAVKELSLEMLPPPATLPPIPTPPASLRSHLEASSAPTVREGKRKKASRDRLEALPSYSPEGVTMRMLRRSGIPAEPAPKRGMSWGWAAALVVVGVGGYAAGKLGAFEGASSVSAARNDLAAASRAPTEEAMPVMETPAPSPVVEPPPVAEPQPIVAVPVSSPVVEAPASNEVTAPPTTETVPKREDSSTLASRTERASSSRRDPETIAVTPPPPSRQLDPSAASATLSRASAKAMSCTDPRGGQGTVSVTFLPSGAATNVRMDGPYNGTAVANCVEQIFRGARVAPFEGAATTVYSTVRLPGDGKPIN